MANENLSLLEKRLKLAVTGYGSKISATGQGKKRSGGSGEAEGRAAGIFLLGEKQWTRLVGGIIITNSFVVW